MMFQGWNGQRTSLAWDTGYNSWLLHHPQTTSTAPLERIYRERERENPTALRMEKAGNLEERIDSECSSGCQSGWTLYLGRSQDTSAASLQLRTGDEEEDLSMLSDASSGPPLVREKRRSFEEEEDKRKERAFSLEDTASSPLLCCYKATNTIGCRRKKLEMLEQSCSLSKSHFKGKIELEKQLGYLHSFCTCESSTGLQRR